MYKFCGPKLSLFGMLISIWGILQLVSEFFNDIFLNINKKLIMIQEHLGRSI